MFGEKCHNKGGKTVNLLGNLQLASHSTGAGKNRLHQTAKKEKVRKFNGAYEMTRQKHTSGISAT